jgi:DNA-binding CsgD family transcriptional regulator/pimeloyl-ACP methyl ester carboxylesterase
VIDETSANSTAVDDAEVGQRLQDSLARQSVGEALLDAWSYLEAFADRQPGVLGQILEAAASDAAPGERGECVDPDALAFGIFDAGGRLRAADRRFGEWVGDAAGGAHVRGIVRRAAVGGKVIASLQTARFGVLAVLAIHPAPTRAWPLASERLGSAPRDGVLAVVFAPTRSRALIGRAAEALGLTPLQAQLCAALATAPNLQSAAASLGVSVHTAKDALSAALRRTGASGAPKLLSRLLDLGCWRTSESPNEAASQILALTPTESEVSVQLAEGRAIRAVAETLGVSTETVRSHRRNVFAKTGVNRTRDLARLMTETNELQRLSDAAEVRALEHGPAGLRVLPAPDGRMVALADYGPAGAQPVLIFHGYSTGATIPSPLLAALRAMGRRPIVPMRPGFGLTSAAHDGYLTQAVSDLSLLCDGLDLAKVQIIARDGGAAVAVEFSTALPHRFAGGVLINAQTPAQARWRRRTPAAAVIGMLLRRPALIEPLVRLGSRHMRRETQLGNMRRVFQQSPSDLACLEDAAIVEQLLDDMSRLGGRTIRGQIDEYRLWADGWRPPSSPQAAVWRLAVGAEIEPHASALEAWTCVTSERPVLIEGAGLLAQFSAPRAVAALLPSIAPFDEPSERQGARRRARRGAELGPKSAA